MLSFKCRDVGFDCSYEVNDSNDETIITKVKEHGKNGHKMSPNDFKPELLEKIKGSIKEEE